MTKENTTAPAAAVATANFAEYLLEETSRVELELPNGEPMLYGGQVVAVNLYGPATKQYAKARDALEKEATKNVMRVMGNNKTKKSAEAEAESDAQFLTGVTANFENFPYPGGADAIYREPRLKYVANQVRAHLNDLGNFFGKSKPS